MGTTVKIRARDVLRGRLPRPSDDSGNIAMLLLVILVGATIGSLLLAMIVNQFSSTRFSASRVRSLDAAQAGVDVMLGQLRAAKVTDASNKTYGNADSLPCSAVNGTANPSGAMTYSVTVAYYTSDPAKGATPMSCINGYGPYDPTSGTHTPRYAKITSFGLDSSNPNSASKGRTITTTYIFQTDDVNIPGGQIQLFPDNSGNKWCMDAGSATPGVGTTVVLRACSTALPPPPQQVWAYRSDLSIQLVSSVTATQPTGLCLDTPMKVGVGGVAVPTTVHAVGDTLVLNKCNAVGTAPWNQQWSVDDNAHLEGAKTDQSDLDGFCITGAQANLQTLVLALCTGGTTDTAQTWVPSITTGAGMAGAGNNQIVNYQKFATCIDVTSKDVTSTFLILYTCKQNPNPTNVAWNQKFTPALGPISSTALPLTKQLVTSPGGANYCLQSPATTGGYVTVSTACSSTWTWNQTKDAHGAALPYAQVYTIVDSVGRCLAPGPSTDLVNGQYYKVIVTTCDGSTAQKWNADPSVLASRLTNTGEK